MGVTYSLGSRSKDSPSSGVGRLSATSSWNGSMKSTGAHSKGSLNFSRKKRSKVILTKICLNKDSNSNTVNNTNLTTGHNLSTIDMKTKEEKEKYLDSFLLTGETEAEKPTNQFIKYHDRHFHDSWKERAVELALEDSHLPERHFQVLCENYGDKTISRSSDFYQQRFLKKIENQNHYDLEHVNRAAKAKSTQSQKQPHEDAVILPSHRNNQRIHGNPLKSPRSTESGSQFTAQSISPFLSITNTSVDGSPSSSVSGAIGPVDSILSNGGALSPKKKTRHRVRTNLSRIISEDSEETHDFVKNGEINDKLSPTSALGIAAAVEKVSAATRGQPFGLQSSILNTEPFPTDHPTARPIVIAPSPIATSGIGFGVGLGGSNATVRNAASDLDELSMQWNGRKLSKNNSMKTSQDEKSLTGRLMSFKRLTATFSSPNNSLHDINDLTDSDILSPSSAIILPFDEALSCRSTVSNKFPTFFPSHSHSYSHSHTNPNTSTHARLRADEHSKSFGFYSKQNKVTPLMDEQMKSSEQSDNLRSDYIVSLDVTPVSQDEEDASVEIVGA